MKFCFLWQRELQKNLLSLARQTEKNKYYMASLTCVIQNK